MTCIGIISAGAMGSALAHAWGTGGARVVTTVDGRSERTAERARAAGLEILPGLADVVAQSEVVVSIAPPDQARPIAEAITVAAGQSGATPVVADLNATAPTTVDQLVDTLGRAGLRLLDGAISGPPPRPGGPTTVYLSGPDADLLAGLPADGVRTHVVGTRAGRASAVKMCTASVLKGFDALLTQALMTARVHGVERWVVDDLAQRYPAQMQILARELALAASKAWRYVPEMREIASTQAAAGARGELFEAIAAVWGMVSASAAGDGESAPQSPSLEQVLDALARSGGSSAAGGAAAE